MGLVSLENDTLICDTDCAAPRRWCIAVWKRVKSATIWRSCPAANAPIALVFLSIVVDLTVVVLDGRRWESRVAFAEDRAGTSPS